MTHHTDEERAEFEAWYIGWARKQNSALVSWTDDEVRDSLMARRPDDQQKYGLYGSGGAQSAWQAWQAARRAPAAPVPQGLRKAAQGVVDRWDTPLWKDVPATAVYIADLRAALAAAPQPPEAAQASVSNGTFAAPVQLPEPAAWRDPKNFLPSQGCTYEKSTAKKWAHIYTEPLYTEQQVRELLAAQNLKRENPTSNEKLLSQPTFKTEDGVEARKPLTNEQVDVCWGGLMPSGCGKSRYDIARAIERAHGIGKDKA